MKGGDVHIEIVPEQLAIAGLVSDQNFRFEVGVALDVGEKRQAGNWFDRSVAGKLQVLVKAAGGANGAGDGAPKSHVIAGRPQQARAGLNLKSAEIVVLKLGPEDQVQAVGNKGDAVAQRRAVNVVRGAVRRKV